MPELLLKFLDGITLANPIDLLAGGEYTDALQVFGGEPMARELSVRLVNHGNVPMSYFLNRAFVSNCEIPILLRRFLDTMSAIWLSS